MPQVYVRYPPGLGEPGAQLKGFDTVRLEAGERRCCTIDISSDDLMIFDEQSGSRILAAGEYEFRAGLSSRDIRATAVITLGAAPADEPVRGSECVTAGDEPALSAVGSRWLR